MNTLLRKLPAFAAALLLALAAIVLVGAPAHAVPEDSPWPSDGWPIENRVPEDPIVIEWSPMSPEAAGIDPCDYADGDGYAVAASEGWVYFVSHDEVGGTGYVWTATAEAYTVAPTAHAVYEFSCEVAAAPEPTPTVTPTPEPTTPAPAPTAEPTTPATPAAPVAPATPADPPAAAPVTVEPTELAATGPAEDAALRAALAFLGVSLVAFGVAMVLLARRASKRANV